MTVPAGWTVGVVYAIPSGGFVGLGMSQSQSTNSYQIFTSPDGLTWRSMRAISKACRSRLTPWVAVCLPTSPPPL